MFIIAQNSQKMPVINWQTTNGHTGKGTTNITIENCNAWLEYLSKEYPEMRHWLTDSKDSKDSL